MLAEPWVRSAFVIGTRVKHAHSAAVGEVVAIDGEAITVRWSDNRTSIHLSADLKPLEAAPAQVHWAFEVGARVTRTLNGPVDEIIAIEGEAITVRWPGDSSSTHLRRDLRLS